MNKYTILSYKSEGEDLLGLVPVGSEVGVGEEWWGETPKEAACGFVEECIQDGDIHPGCVVAVTIEGVEKPCKYHVEWRVVPVT